MGKLKKFTAGYTVTPNEIINNKKLSLKAVGLWTYINSKPDGWNFSARGIASQVNDGERAVGSGLRELEAEGFLERIKVQNEDGFSGADYYLYDTAKRISAKRTDAFRINAKQLDSSNKELSKPILSKPLKKITPSKKADKKTMFKNSAVYDLETFKEKLKRESDLGVNLEYYFNNVLDWSNIKDNKILRTATGWIATARSFMRGDKDKNKLVMIAAADVSLKNDSNAVEYLNM